MGSLYSRAGYGTRAESAWLEALALDDDPSAMSNLARYYDAAGEEERALWYAQRVEQYRQRNPYYLYDLADAAYQRGDYPEAQALLQRALKMREDEHQFHRLQGMVHLKTGDREDALRSFQLAEEYASSEHERRIYNQKQRLIVQVSQ